MEEFIVHLQIAFGLVIALIVVGWCLWRVLIFFGFISARKTKNRSTIVRKDHKEKTPISLPAHGSKGKKSMPTISRQALYSSRKQSDE